MAKRVAHRSRGGTDTKLVHPRREWFIGLTFFLLIVIGGSVANLRDHTYYNSLDTSVERTSVPIKEYRSDSIREAIETYNARATRFETLVSDVSREPSRPVASTTTSTVDVRENDASAGSGTTQSGTTSDASNESGESQGELDTREGPLQFE